MLFVSILRDNRISERFTLAIYAEVVYRQSLYQIPRQSILYCQGGAPAAFALPMSPEGSPVEETARCTYRQVATAMNNRARMNLIAYLFSGSGISSGRFKIT